MSMALRPIHRIKHVVDSQFGMGINSINTIPLITTVDNPILANSAEVETGAKVNGIYLRVEAYMTSGAGLANFYIAIFKNPGNNLPSPGPNVIGTNDNKRFIIHQEMVMLQKVVNGNPRTIFNGVVVIPKGYRRFAPDDRLLLLLIAPGVGTDVCLQCHYKEFR